MIYVETIDLAQRGITLPSDRVGMVIAQPYLTLSAIEPYRCTQAAKAGQLEVLTATLAVARAAPHGAAKTHFTVFPEYGIPGLDGVAQVQAVLEADDWPIGTFVIGGTDALTKEEFAELAGSPRTHLNTNHNPLLRIADNEWINCGITWAKAVDGTVERWLQPKLFPALLEQDVPYQDMFRGDSVFTFKGTFENNTEYHFSTLICFDWVFRTNNQRAWTWVLDDLGRQVAPGELSLSWFFVIQCNPKPSHDTFLTEVGGFFDQNTVPNVRRDRTCLVFANSAGLPGPGRATTFGGTSLIFAPQPLFAKPTCHATFSNGGERFRSSTLLLPYRDVFFRERGACIHSFVQVNPASLNVGAAGRMFPVLHPSVSPLPGTNDPRAPAAPVPACIKWLNDELDSLPSLSAQYSTAPLAAQADTVHRQTVTDLRAISAQSADHVVKLACAESQVRLTSTESRQKHADEWDDAETKAVEHLVHTLDIIELGYPHTAVGADPAHATAVMKGQTVDLLAIRGNTHQACIEHSKTFVPLPRRQFLLVSRDRDNTPWRKKFGSFLEPNTPQLGQERRFTDPDGGLLHLGYARLLDIFRQSPTSAAVQGAINAELVA